MKDVRSSMYRPHMALAAATVVLLVACGDKTASTSKSGQWVAKVDGREITVHQVNAELRNVGSTAAGASADALQQKAVENLVDRQLLVAAAAKAKYDRDPEVMQAIEMAREKIIAQTYLRKKLAGSERASDAEVTEYFNKHPELFTKRKQYEMRQLTVDAAAFTDEVRATVDAAKSLDEVETALAAKSVKFTKGRSTKTSADLPAPMLEKISDLTTGKPFVLRTPGNVSVATLVFVKDVPVSEQDAAPQIQTYLANVRARDTVTGELARLRKEASVVYQAGYGPAPSDTPESAPAASQQAPGLPLPSEGAAKDSTGSHVDRGVAGLR